MVRQRTREDQAKMEEEKELLKILNDSILRNNVLKHRTAGEINRIWTSLYSKYQKALKTVKGNMSNSKQVPVEFQTTAYHLVLLAQETSTFEQCKIPPSFNNFISELHQLLLNKNIKLCLSLEICKLYSALHIKGFLTDNVTHYISVLHFYVRDVVRRKQPRCVIRLWRHRSYTKLVPWELQTAEPVLKSVLFLCKQDWFLNFRLGREFLLYFILASVQFGQGLESLIKRAINRLNNSNFFQYGIICSSAYAHGEREVKNVMKNILIFVLETMFFIQLKSNPLESKTQSKNGMAFIKGFTTNNENVKASLMFSRQLTMRTWGYLEQSQKMSRNNACSIFLEYYPLQWLGDACPENQKSYLEYQNKYITKLLHDGCHYVRAQAAQGVGKILSKHWDLIPNDFILEWVKIIAEDLAYDCSSYLVRKAAVTCFQHMLDEPKADLVLLNELPKLKGCLSDDKHEDIPSEYLNLLLKIKRLDRFKYWDIIPVERLVSCLRNEGLQNAVVDLLYNSYLCNSSDSADQLFHRLMLLLALDHTCGKIFFARSHGRLTAEDAISIVLTIVQKLDEHVCRNHSKKYRDISSVVESSVEIPEKRRRTEYNIVDGVTVFDKDISCEIRVAKVISSANLNNRLVMFGIIDILNVLWEDYIDCIEGRDSTVDNIKYTLKNCFETWFSHFQGSDVFIPLMKFLCHVPYGEHPLPLGYCLNRLVSMTTTAEHSNQCAQYVDAVCSLGYVTHILNLANRFLDKVMKIPSWTDHSSLKNSDGGNIGMNNSPFTSPMFALDLINHVFQNHLLRDSLKPHLNSILKFWEGLVKIKELILWRLTLQMADYNLFVMDKFVEKCFFRYAKLIPLLECIDKEEFRKSGYKSVPMFMNLMEWAKQSLLPVVPQSLPTCEENNPNLYLMFYLLQDLICVATDMTDIGKCGTELIIKMSTFLSTICQHESGLPLVMLALNYSRGAIGFLHAYYKNATGTSIVNEQIIPLITAVMNMVANIQNENLISEWLGKEDIFWSYIKMVVEKIYCFSNKDSESTACIFNIVSAVIHPAIIPLRARIINDSITQYACPAVTYKVLSLVASKAVIRTVYPKIFEDSMDKANEKDVDTLLAELNFLMMIVCGIKYIKIEYKHMMFSIAERSWNKYFTEYGENNHVSERHVQIADEIFSEIKKYLSQHREPLDISS